MSSLKDFLDRCRECEVARDRAGGLLACEELLAQKVKGRLLAAVLMQKAKFLLWSGEKDVGEAVGCLREALPLTAAYPAERAYVLHMLVMAYSHYGSWEFARPYADQYFQLAAPETGWDIRKWTPRVWFNLGYCYNTAKQYADSVATYIKAIETTGPDPAWFNPGLAEHNLVEVYLTLGQLDLAEDMLVKAKRDLDPETWGSRIKEQEAECLLATGQHVAAQQAANDACDHVSATDDVRAEALFVLARVANCLGNLAEARQFADRALDLAIRISLSRVVRRINEFQKALDVRKEVS